MSKATSRPIAEFVAPHVRSLPPSGIRRFFDLVAQSKGIISLGVGEPDFVTPWHVRDAGIFAIERGYTTYTSNWGMPELRQAVSDYLRNWQQLAYDPDGEILITVGAAEGIDLAMRALLAPGDEVLIPEPCFVSYPACASLAGGVPVAVPLSMDNEFKLTAAALRAKITPRSKVLLIGFPNNPTGAVMTAAEMTEIAAVAAEHDLFVVSDEIYGELTYHGEHTAFSRLPGMRERTLLLSGLSKAFAMTGWRLGYACGPRPVLEAMFKIHQYAVMCAPIVSQLAGVEALQRGHAEMLKMRAEYDRRRQLMVRGFADIGLPCFEPQGAFYIFPRVADTGMDDETFAVRLLEEEKVAVVPGRAFGASGTGYVRCAYATSVEKLSEALARIGRFVARHKR